MNVKFKEGQIVIYTKGDKYQIGKIKSLNETHAFVWYHGGDTAARTDLTMLIPIDDVSEINKFSPIINGYCMEEILAK